MKKLFWLVIGIMGLMASDAGAQNLATSSRGNASLTNCLVVSARNGTKLYTVQGYLALTTTAFVQVFQTNNVPANASVPTFSFPVAATNYFSMDFGAYGCDLDKITVCISTNAATLGIAATNAAGIQAVVKNP
jgi:hypothetical protein